MNGTLDDSLLDALLARLEAARAWSPRVVSKLENAIRTGEDLTLFRVNPLRFAADHKLDEPEAIDLFLHAAHVGLFALEWHMLCAFCGSVVESLAELSTVHARYECRFCQAQNQASLDELIQVSFTLSRRVRALRYHSPSTLDIDDYCLRCGFSSLLDRFPNGMTLAEIAAVTTRYRAWLGAGERVRLELPLEPGLLQVRDLRHRAGLAVFAGERSASPEPLALTLHEREVRVADRAVAARRVEQTVATFQYPAACDVPSGALPLEVANATDEAAALWITFLPAAFESGYVTFHPGLSGRRLITSQTFRDLFRTETLSVDEGIAVNDVTLLFTDLKSSTQMYDDIGDLNAFHLVRQHFETLTQAIERHQGAIVKTIGDAVMATFLRPTDALAASLEMLRGLEELNATIPRPLHLKVGIHAGPSIVVTLNDRLDYFGQTVNTAARVQGLAGADEIYLSRAARQDPGVQRLLDGCDVVDERVELRGVSGLVDVSRVTRR